MLSIPGIIQTYSLEPFQNAYILVMEDFGGISLKDYFANNNYVAYREEFLQIAISLCDTLDILYSQIIIHKDIKPTNILINPETKEVKLIDFTISSLLPQKTPTLKTKAVGKGTGLGLAIAQSIVVEKHGVSIQCNSSPGQGTEFVILLPVQQ